MDTVEMKAFHMMENREDVAVARATVGMIMMANSKEGGQSGDYLRKRQLQRHMIKKIRNR